ncbi:MAG: DUF4394 domain-containing protein [Ilumatobacteraceae bacterium]
MRLRRTATGAAIAGAIALTTGITGFTPSATAAPPNEPVLALAMNNLLIGFNATAPGTFTSSMAIIGLQPGEMIVGLDIRPATGEVIGIGVTGTTGRVYRIDKASGVATAIGSTPFSTALPAGGTWAVDFNPTVDRIRVVHSTGLNLRVNPLNGALAATDTPISGGTASAASYDRPLATSTVTTLYAIDASSSQLVTVGGIDSAPSPNLGALSARGPLGVAVQSDFVGFDISPTGSALATLRNAGATGLYEISLASGAATSVGTVGSGAFDILDLAVLPQLPAGASAFTAVAPTRLLDTREDFPGGKPTAGATLDLQVTGIAGVPANATAVVLNTTGTQATADGFVTAYPAGEVRTEVSNHNLVAGQTRANLVTVKIGAGGRVSLYTQSGTHMVVDIFGYYAPATGTAGRFTPLTPGRLVDTRTSAKLAPGTAIDIQATGMKGVPAAGVAAVLVNLTPTEADGFDVITAYATGQPKPGTSNTNTDRIGGTNSNLAVVPVGAGGKITVHSLRGTHLVVDVVGWYGDATAKGGYTGLFVPLSPNRILDTRSGVGAPVGALPINGSLDLTVAGFGGVPATGASAALLNVTDVDVTRAGFVNVYPTGSPLIEVSTVNVDLAGQTVPNLVSATLGTGGKVTMFSYTGGHLLADVAGWFTA